MMTDLEDSDSAEVLSFIFLKNSNDCSECGRQLSCFKEFFFLPKKKLKFFRRAKFLKQFYARKTKIVFPLNSIKHALTRSRMICRNIYRNILHIDFQLVPVFFCFNKSFQLGFENCATSILWLPTNDWSFNISSNQIRIKKKRSVSHNLLFCKVIAYFFKRLLRPTTN